LLHAIVEASDDALVTHDAALTITSWNHASERLFGYRTAEIVGQSYVVLFPDHLQNDARAIFATVMTGDRVNHFETEVMRKADLDLAVALAGVR
jgi:PAS domain S-box-containing protein